MIQVLETIKIIDIDHNELSRSLLAVCNNYATYKDATEGRVSESIVSAYEILEYNSAGMSKGDKAILQEIVELQEQHSASYFRLII